MKPSKPLWGFGWAGMCLLPVMITLAWSYFSGYDLRHQALGLINDTLGIRAVFWTVLHPIFYNWVVVDLPGFGWWGLLWALVALHIHPRGVAWYECLILVVWIVVRTELFLWFLRVPGAGPGAWMMSATGGWLDAMGAALLVCGLVDATLLGVMSRSPWVAGAVVAATIAGIPAYRYVSAQTASAPAYMVLLPACGYHIIAGGAMLSWGICARMKRTPPWCCQACGYDLRGSPTGKCPECGNAAVRAAPSIGAAAGVNSPP